MTAVRRTPAAVAFLAVVLLTLTRCGEEPRYSGLETRRRVLLITVDTLRADAVSSERYGLPTTPFIDSLLAEGLRFTSAMTTIPRTTQALASLLTGTYPHHHGVRRLWDPLRKDIATLPALARAAGYATVAVVSNHILTPERGLSRGFEIYDHAGDARDAAGTTRAVIRALEGRDPNAALFVWAHYIDPHVSYHPPKDLARRFDRSYDGPYAEHFGASQGGIGDSAYPEDLGKVNAVYRNQLPERVNEHVRRLYAAEVRHTDNAISELVRWLRARFGHDWVILFTSDHGEDLGEHGTYYDHGDTVYQSALHIPLGLVLPPSDPLHRKALVRDRVSLVDVAPTLAELLGLNFPDAAHVAGRSLVPYLRAEQPRAAVVFAESGESFYPDYLRRRVRFDVSGRFRTAVDGRWKLVFTPGLERSRAFELYDLDADPAEGKDLFRPDHPAAVRLRLELARWMGEASDAVSSHAPSAADLEALQALGYVETPFQN